MFSHFKNIDSAFTYIRMFSIVFLLANVSICCYVVFTSARLIEEAKGRIYVIANGKLLEASAIDRKEKLPVEIRDHVSAFHRLFFNLEPDEQLIRTQLAKSLYLADSSAKMQFSLLDESGYYSGVVSGNISQRLSTDSVGVDTNQTPWYVKFYGRLSIIRSTSIVTRSLITEAWVRDLQSVSDNNPHGFLLERWKIIENKDLAVMPR
jgi:conjugative transposon TraK protein